MCSQVSEPRAGCHASGHSWRIHLSFGMSSSSSRRSQWAVPSLMLNTSMDKTAQQPLGRNVTKRTVKTTKERAEAAVVKTFLTVFWSR